MVSAKRSCSDGTGYVFGVQQPCPSSQATFKTSDIIKIKVCKKEEIICLAASHILYVSVGVGEYVGLPRSTDAVSLRRESRRRC